MGIRGPGPGTARIHKSVGGESLRPMTSTAALDQVHGMAWCDTREAAMALGVLPDGVARLVEQGRLIRHTKPGTFPYYSRREVAALAAELRQEEETA